MPAWFDYLEESFPYKGVRFENFCPPVKTRCSPAEFVNKTPAFFPQWLPVAQFKLSIYVDFRLSVFLQVILVKVLRKITL